MSNAGIGDQKIGDHICAAMRDLRRGLFERQQDGLQPLYAVKGTRQGAEGYPHPVPLRLRRDGGGCHPGAGRGRRGPAGGTVGIVRSVPGGGATDDGADARAEVREELGWLRGFFLHAIHAGTGYERNNF